MTGNEYQKLAARTCSIPYERNNDMLMHAVLGLNSEAFPEGFSSERSIHRKEGDI